MRALKCIALSLVIVSVVPGAHARADEPSATPAADAAAAPRIVVLHANSLVALRLLETVGSDTHIAGAMFALEVNEDVTVAGVVVIPAGSKVEGQVIHAAKSSVFGKAGELIVTSRFVMVGDRKVKLHSLMSGTGESRANLAAVFWPFIKGKKVIIPADTELVAKIFEDETFVVPPPAG
jgi:hypothetical protein